MRTWLAGLFLSTGMLVTGSALANEPPAPPAAEACPIDAQGIPNCPKPQLELGLRTGVALPTGSLQSGQSLGDAVALQVPVQIDFGVRAERHVFLGAYGSLGVLFPGGSTCASGTCEGTDVRVGIEGQYRFQPGLRWDPWVGVGAGYEWLHVGYSATGGEPVEGRSDTSITLRGFELLNLQAGLDYAVCSGLHIGPFASFAIDEFSNAKTSWTTQTVVHEQSADITNTALHEWLTLGVRGTFDL
jgi:hypothetical protein